MELSKMTFEAGKTETSYAKIFFEVNTDHDNDYGFGIDAKYISFHGEAHDDKWWSRINNIYSIGGQVKKEILELFPTEKNKQFIELFWNKYHLTPYNEKVIKEIEAFTGCKFINR